MEPVSTFIATNLFGWGISKVAETIWQGAGDRIQKTIHKSDIERGIKSGLTAAAEWEKQQNPQDLLFYSMSPDGFKGVPRFLEKVFSDRSVQQQLRRPLEDEKTPEIEYLVEVFKRVEKTDKKYKLNHNKLDAWISEFVKGYFEATTAYLNFQITKKCYLKQLAKFYDDVKFAGIDVTGEESEKSEILAQIFVMPDVIEDVSNRNLLEIDLLDNGNTNFKHRLENTSGRKFLASQLLHQVASKKAVLLGAPGSGKTTLLSYFAVMLARGHSINETLGLDENTDWLPIIIRMRDFGRYSDISLLDYIKKSTEESLCVAELPAGFFEYWLTDGRALILIDGLDEIANSAKRSQVSQMIDNFLHQYNQNHAIITSRPAGYRRDFFRTDEFPHFQLEEFDDEKIETFIQNWYNSRVPDPVEADRRKESIKKALDDNERIKLLARNPLLLTIISLIHRYRAVLPKERYQLYDRAVDTLLTAWDANKELRNHETLEYLKLDDLRRLMEQLAYWIHTQGNQAEKEGGTLIDKDELMEQLSREIKRLKRVELYQAREEAGRFIDFIRERTGLLNEQGIDYYAFVHKTFQEYLCAQDIHYRADDEEDFDIILNPIREHLHDSHWREALLLLIAQQKPKKAAKAIREILKQDSEYEQWLHRDLLLAGYCLAEDPKNLNTADDTLAEEILQQLVDLETQPDEKVGRKVRQQVFKIFCSLYESQFETQTLQLLKAQSELIDFDQLLRYRAALGEKEAVIKIYLQRLTDDYYFVRNEAAEALGELGKTSDAVVDALIKCLSDDNSDVRFWAASALVKLGKTSDAVVDGLVKCLSDDNSDVRYRAASALVKLGKTSDAVVDALIKCLKDDNSFVRIQAASALVKLGNTSETVVDALIKCLKDDNSFVRIQAAEALGKLGKTSDKILPCIIQWLEQHQESKFIGSGIDVLWGCIVEE